MNTASTISQRDAYKLMLKDYPDVMSIEQMCEILSISTKTGYRILFDSFDHNMRIYKI